MQVMVSIYRLKWVSLAVTSSMLRPVPKAALVACLGQAEQGTTLQAEVCSQLLGSVS